MAIIGAHIIRDLPEEYKIYAEKTLLSTKSNNLTVMALLWDKTINVDGMKTGHTSQAEVITLSHQQQVQTICV